VLVSTIPPERPRRGYGSPPKPGKAPFPRGKGFFLQPLSSALGLAL